LEEAYHSLPESGDAKGVGLTTCKDVVVAPLEQEGHVPPEKNTFSSWRSYFNADRRKTLVQMCYLGIAAIFGTLLRMILAQLFGEECANPGTVGWLAASSPLCVTAAGETSQQGGIVFADLPANLLGSFIMGLLQDGKSLGLAVDAPIAWLSPTHAFQSHDIFHLAIKTGFCGSLTTFSSWNSEMVVMMVGEGATHMPSQVWKAMFGYIIGLETALGSYAFGRVVAWWLHSARNPLLAEESKAMKVRESHGVYIHKALPEFERRYLPDLPMAVVNEVDLPNLEALKRWRASTKEARRVESGWLETLKEIETAVFIEQRPILPETEEVARKQNWDIDGLQEWVNNRPIVLQGKIAESPSGVLKPLSEGDDFRWFTLPYAGSIVAVIFGILITLLIVLDVETAYEITDRTMVYVLFFSAPGALLRWKLSGLNGKLPVDRWSWLPAGTLLANVLGACVSISMIAVEYQAELSNYNGFWIIATVRAIKVGFSGCLTTVSTFVSEVHGMTQLKQDRGYKYILITLAASSLLSMLLFCVIVYI
jgi:fluoride ion exporter CrcB/FEX